MTAPHFITETVGWIRGVPNIADRDNRPSIAIATEILRLLGVSEAQTGVPGSTAGGMLERGVRDHLIEHVPPLHPSRTWVIGNGRRVVDFVQYEHLGRLQELIEADETKTLRAELGREYVIRPDVTVGILQDEQLVLHAAVSCKWTIRSDRVQNIRHEAVILTRHRRGRQPHIVAVTMEPLPSRLAAIARGTGEVDAVYHVAFQELVESVEAVGGAGQRDVLDELTGQRRLLDFNQLAPTLTV